MSDDDNESSVEWTKIVMLAAGAVGGVVAGGAVRRAWLKYKQGSANDMARRIVSEARRLCTPTPPLDYVGPGDPRWDDEVCGGLIVPGQWQWYQDGYGTTCAVTACAILERAGAGVWISPLTGASGRLLLNRPEPVGVGFVPGAWAERFVSGGDRCGIRLTDPDLKPGDLYHIVRGGDPAKWHVGIVLERSGSSLLTADGGQRGPATATAPSGAQCARLSRRTLKGKMLGSSIAEPGEITWRISW